MKEAMKEVTKAPQKPARIEDPVQDALGYRPHANLCLEAGVPVNYQDVLSVSLHKLRQLIASNVDVRNLSERCISRPFAYDGLPESAPMPYFFPTALNVASERGVPPQSYYYALRLWTGGGYVLKEPLQADTLPRRHKAEAWRDLLFDSLPEDVRLAYVAPTQDAVYLVCQGFMNGHPRLSEFERSLRQAQRYMLYRILKMLPEDLATHIQVTDCAWCYLAHDEGARWRPFIEQA
jgi:hypothetical protein